MNVPFKLTGHSPIQAHHLHGKRTLKGNKKLEPWFLIMSLIFQLFFAFQIQKFFYKAKVYPVSPMNWLLSVYCMIQYVLSNSWQEDTTTIQLSYNLTHILFIRLTLKFMIWSKLSNNTDKFKTHTRWVKRKFTHYNIGLILFISQPTKC